MKKNLIKKLAVLSVMVLLTACEIPQVPSTSNSESTSENQVVAVAGVAVTAENDVRNIVEEQTLQLTATVYPAEASQEITWTSSDTTIATVNETGLVTAVKAGNVTIVATSVADSTVSASYALIVEAKAPEVILPTSVEISSANNATTVKTGETLALSAVVLPDGANQRVTWTSSDETLATVSRGTVTALKEGNVTITATSDELTTVFDSIELTIEKGDDPVTSKDWASSGFSTHEQYMTCENDTPLKVKGVVTHVTPLKDGNVNYYLQNGTEGFYVYAQNAASFPVELGKSYEVGGFKKYYRGLNEIVNVEYLKETDAITYTVNDLAGKNPSSLEEMNPYHCSVVTGEAVISGNVSVAAKAYSVDVEVNGYDTVLRVDPAALTAEEFEAVNAKFATAIKGSKLTFTGIMSAFGYGAASPQIQVIDADLLQFETLSDADLLTAAKGNLTVTGSIKADATTITLPTSIVNYDGVAVSWASDSDLINVSTGVVTHGEQDTIVTLTATLTLNSETTTQSFKVNVFGSANNFETVASLNLEDASTEGSYGTSATKGSYAAATVELGTPVSTWLLDQALIAGGSSDPHQGNFGIRVKAGGRIEIQEDNEYNYVQFDAAVYGNDPMGIKVGVEYSLDEGSTWVDSGMVVSVNSKTLETFRIALPAGVKRVAIYVVTDSGVRVNIDNILLMK